MTVSFLQHMSSVYFASIRPCIVRSHMMQLVSKPLLVILPQRFKIHAVFPLTLEAHGPFRSQLNSAVAVFQLHAFMLMIVN